MTAALTVVGASLQLVLYRSFAQSWLALGLPLIVGTSFAVSTIVGVMTEIQRLVGGPLLASVLLGAYHRPTRRRLIVMFLDLANSTRLAEAMGELRVHDLITRFFFDVDEPDRRLRRRRARLCRRRGDRQLAGDGRPERNARCLACFFAIERKIAGLAPDYEAKFGVVPAFRAGIHAGAVVVSECGDAKRQLAYFGDAMNVASRLCEYCKTINRRLVVSGELLRLVQLPDGLEAGEGKSVAARGRQEPGEARVVELRPLTLG